MASKQAFHSCSSDELIGDCDPLYSETDQQRIDGVQRTRLFEVDVCADSYFAAWGW
jgi:hypothetical protein